MTKRKGYPKFVAQMTFTVHQYETIQPFLQTKKGLSFWVSNLQTLDWKKKDSIVIINISNKTTYNKIARYLSDALPFSGKM